MQGGPSWVEIYTWLRCSLAKLVNSPDKGPLRVVICPAPCHQRGASIQHEDTRPKSCYKVYFRATVLGDVEEGLPIKKKEWNLDSRGWLAYIQEMVESNFKVCSILQEMVESNFKVCSIAMFQSE